MTAQSLDMNMEVRAAVRLKMYTFFHDNIRLWFYGVSVDVVVSFHCTAVNFSSKLQNDIDYDFVFRTKDGK